MKKIRTLAVFIFISFTAIAQIVPPYYNDFQTNVAGWYADTAIGSYQWAVPANAMCTGKVWGIGLNASNYTNSFAALYSPVFNFSSANNLTVSFIHEYQTEIFQDGIRLETTIDSGLSWQVLGDNLNSCSCQTSWYNTFIVTSSGLTGWTGTTSSICCNASAPYCTSIGVSNLSGNASVQFRFVYMADTANNSERHLIYNFSISGTVGISNPAIENEPFFISTNPVNKILTLNLNKGTDVVLTNLFGQIVMHKNFSNDINRKVELDVSDLSTGVYFVRAGNEVRKFVKE